MNFGFIVFNDLEELDLVGPWEMIGIWGLHALGPRNRLMIGESDSPVTCTNGMRIIPHTTFADAPDLDYLLVPGGAGARKEASNRQLTAFVARQARCCKAILSVCTGAFVLHAAGLLKGKKATTHWLFLQKLGELGEVSILEERLVRDGAIWTASGVSAGIDLALALIHQEAGEETAGKVQAYAEYYPDSRRYGPFASAPEAPGYLKR
jgi:transcriptional regulator GlxA family with amidase domain